MILRLYTIIPKVTYNHITKFTRNLTVVTHHYTDVACYPTEVTHHYKVANHQTDI